jgi:hypothetical protein
MGSCKTHTIISKKGKRMSEPPCKNCISFAVCKSKYHSMPAIRVYDILMNCFIVTGKNYTDIVEKDDFYKMESKVIDILTDAIQLFNRRVGK